MELKTIIAIALVVFIIGGLIFGLIEQVGAQFITSTMASMLSFILFLIVLVIKPDGLLGKKK